MHMILVRIRIQVQREVIIWIRMRMQIFLVCKECIKIALKRRIFDTHRIRMLLYVDPSIEGKCSKMRICILKSLI